MSNSIIYKERPLVRNKDLLYYGNITDKYILKLNVLEGIDLGGLFLASKVRVELLDITKKDAPKMVKTAERDGLYSALEIGEIWLTRMLSEKI